MMEVSSKGKKDKTHFRRCSMDQIEKKQKLLRDYGYPEKAIPRLMEEIRAMDYGRLEKLILPYNDITSDKS
jgi:hypothetical protein